MLLRASHANIICPKMDKRRSKQCRLLNLPFDMKHHSASNKSFHCTDHEHVSSNLMPHSKLNQMCSLTRHNLLFHILPWFYSLFYPATTSSLHGSENDIENQTVKHGRTRIENLSSQSLKVFIYQLLHIFSETMKKLCAFENIVTAHKFSHETFGNKIRKYCYSVFRLRNRHEERHDQFFLNKVAFLLQTADYGLDLRSQE